MHTLTAIRQALVTLLSGHTAAGSRVWGSQTRSIGDAELPALQVLLTGRKTRMRADVPDYVQRGDFVVVVQVAAGDTADDQAESLLDEVERLLTRSPTLDGLLAHPLRTTRLQVVVEGNRLRYLQGYRAIWHEEPFAELEVTEPHTAPRFADFTHLHADLDAPPFASAAEHARWLNGDYSGERPDAQIDFHPPGPTP
ncbi:hypothetical protein GCM10007860_09110 [Chitiniphilus shinanonensis]|uniref:Uncharacterized protein n=1 Tax=Chitiniphilus shinanonensis TaxID=553088 RepID=A0ABQ6BR10_9NEIS|nr:hypothetical protein [Chitiniphilus shinanonensis]GLS03766.1 hypothetical protein GCM10007860_09110 [Chitiniphilus shinanonensis]